MAEFDFNRVTIVGTGLLGGSVGLALRQLGFEGEIIGVGRRQSTIVKAVQRGCIDRGTNNIAAAVKDTDIVVLATPVNAIIAAIHQIAAIQGNYLITDVGSTKASIVQVANQTLPNPGLFVGAHPMAGSEQAGPEAADPDLFVGRNVIITPSRLTLREAVLRIDQFWKLLGAETHFLDPMVHDQQVARISHLPHAMAVLLVQLAREDDSMQYAATGFRDTTRVASGDPELWADIFLDNKEGVAKALKEWRQMIEQFEEIVETEDRERMLQVLVRAKQSRDAWLTKKAQQQPRVRAAVRISTSTQRPSKESQ